LAADFLFGEPSNPEAPCVQRLRETQRRETDRSRFVSHMRAAALLAAWRRDGVFEAADEPMLFAWRRDDQVAAVAGLAHLAEIPNSGSSQTQIREAKARLEALGAAFELPILATASLPKLDVRPLYDTPKGSLCSILGIDQLTIDVEAGEVSGSEIAGAFGLIFRERAEGSRGIAVWIRSGKHADFHLPIGALLWPWVEELAGVPR